MSLVVLINDINGLPREAIPVRAIPYVTGWRSLCGISPDVLVTCLGRRPSASTQSDPLITISAYKLCSGLPVLVRPDEWNILAVQMADLSMELKKQFPADINGRRDDHGYAVWQVRSIETVPPATFVWLDEFRSYFQKYFDSRDQVSSPEFLGDRELNLAPLLLSETVRKVLMEGFELLTAASSGPQPVAPQRGSVGEEWKEMARVRATEIIRRQHEKDLFPDQEAIAEEIAKEFRRDKVMGAGGKPLTGAYIKRHALKGISSAQGRQLSTSLRRGK